MVTKVKAVGGPGKLIERLLRLPLLHASAVFALSGAAFAIGNLLLARALPVEQFGAFALAIALFNMAWQLAPLGVDQLILRHDLAPDGRMLARLLASGMLVGAIVGGAAYLAGGLEAWPAIIVGLLISAGGVLSAVSQGLRLPDTQRQALMVTTSGSWILCAIGVAAQINPFQESLSPLKLYALGILIVAAAGWIGLRGARAGRAARAQPIRWREAWSLLGLTAVASLGIQLERLIVPVAFSVRELATFSVLASVAIFPFRMVTSGAGFSLLPRLRAAADAAKRRRIVRKEVLAVVAFLMIATLGVVIVAPFATNLITGGRYQIGELLVLAACFNGSAKVMQALPRAILTACGSGRDLAYLNRLGWLGLAAAALGAVAGSEWGLEGLVAGAALGSLFGSLPAIAITRKVLREPFSAATDPAAAARDFLSAK